MAPLDDHAPAPDLPREPRLLPGLPVVRRDADHLQVGVEERCVVLPDRAEVRTLLERLRGHTGANADPVHGPDVSPATLLALARLGRAGLLVAREELTDCLATYADGPAQRAAALASLHSAPHAARSRWAARTRATVRLDGTPADRSALERVLAPAGVRSATDAGEPSPGGLVVLLRDGEPDREELDRLQHEDVPHLLVRSVLDQVVVGPFVEPGRTACVRCLDAHRTDTDPRWPLVLAQASPPGSPDAPTVRDPALWHLALGWAARDVLRWLDGEQPSTRSATVRIGPDLQPRRRAWRRHPRCGCGWADLAAAAHQYSESSFPSIERRCSREQVSQ